MRSDGVNAIRRCSIPAAAISCGVGSAAQMTPRQVAADIEALQPPDGARGWVQLTPDGIIDPQPMLPPSFGTRARRRPSNRRAEPTRRGMIGA
jgi:hypothetical protein